jgi:hypothetical protein
MLFSTNKKKSIGRTLISVTICLVMIATAFSAINKATPINNPTYDTKNPLCYTFSFLAPTIQEKSVLGTAYSSINLPGCLGFAQQAGAPTLPTKFIQLLLPPMTTVDSIVVTGTPVAVQLPGVDLVEQPIFPYQNEVPLNSPMPQKLDVNNDIYESSKVYPIENHEQYNVGHSHGYAIMDFSLNPLQYLPKSGQLYYYPEMKVTINLRYTGEMNQFFANNPDDELYVRSLVSNPEVAALYQGLPTVHYKSGGLCDSRDHYDYVIVTTTQNGLNHWDIGGTLTYNWDSLIAEHNAEGLVSTKVIIEDINANSAYWNSSYYPLFNDTPAHLREFCKDAYQNWGTRYVLIGGDAGPLPSRLMDFEYESDVDADIYFSNLDKNFNQNHNNYWGEEGDLGFDPYAELYIGRVPCEYPQNVSNWLTKSFFYADSSDSDYIENAGFYGGAMGWTAQGDDFVDFGAIKTTTNWLGPNPGEHGPYPTWLGMQYGFETWNLTNPGNMFNLSVKWTAESSPNPGWHGGSQSTAINGLRNAINNNQVTLLSTMDHADPHESCEVYDTDWETLYHNTEPFFITDMGCHCGDFDDSNGVLDVMLFHSDTNLAFACTYNTGYGWGSQADTNSSSCLQMKSFWDYFFDVTNNSQSQAEWRFGRGQAWSKDVMAPTLNWTCSEEPGAWRGVLEGSNYFGDPAQMLKSPHPSNPPYKPSKPGGPNLGIWHVQYSYTSSTTDPDGDQIYYLFDWGDGSNSGWLGPFSSGAVVIGSHTWTVLGTYEVKVKARDTWGAGSTWSDSLTVTITDNTPPNVPTITGPHHGKPGQNYLFNFQTDDGQDQNIWFFIDWGDNTTSGWLGPYVSGTTLHLTHTWTGKMNCTIKAKAKDTMDSESNWGTFYFSTPTVYNPFANIFEWMFSHFPNAFPFFRHLLGYS